MTRYSLDGVAVGVHVKALSSERHTLIQLDIVSEDGGSADYHAGSVVDGEAFANGGCGVYVDTRFAMGLLAYHAGYYRHIELYQLMGYAVVADGAYAGIAIYHLLGGGCSRVASVGGVDIGVEEPAQIGELLDELGRFFGCLVLHLVVIGSCVGAYIHRQSGVNLFNEQVVELFGPQSGEVSHIVARYIAVAEESGKNQGSRKVDDFLDRLL